MVLKSVRFTWSGESGNQIVEVYEGPASSYDAWLATLSGYTSLEYERTSPTHPEAPVRAVVTWAATGAGEKLISGQSDGTLRLTWTLQGVDEQLEVEAHPDVVSLNEAYPGWTQLIRAYVTAFREARQRAIDDWGFGSGTPTLPTWSLPHPVSDPTYQAIADKYARLLLLDDRPTYQVSRWVLRKNLTLTWWSNATASHTEVNRWMTASVLFNREPTVVQTFRFNGYSLAQNYLWLKKTPEISMTWGGNYELTQEYWSGAIPPAGSSAEQLLEFLYGPIIRV